MSLETLSSDAHCHLPPSPKPLPTSGSGFLPGAEDQRRQSGTWAPPAVVQLHQHRRSSCDHVICCKFTRLAAPIPGGGYPLRISQGPKPDLVLATELGAGPRQG